MKTLTLKKNKQLLRIFLLALAGITATITLSRYSRQNAESAVIFDLDGVLFKTSRTGAFKKLGGMTVISYTLKGGSPSKLHDIAFDILFKMRNENPEQYKNNPTWPTYEGQPLPTIMCEWQQGLKDPKEIIREVNVFIEKLDKQKYFKNSREKKLMKSIFDIMFDPVTRLEITKPLAEGLAILKECKKAGYKVYVLSNMDEESMQLLQREYADIFKQFDGIVYSAHANVKQIKPYDPIYTHLLQQYSLTPDQCLFLDNQQENIEAAQKLGIKSMLCTKQTMKTFARLLANNKSNMRPQHLVALV